MRQGAVDFWANVMFGGGGSKAESMEYDRGTLEGFIARTDHEVKDGQPQ